MFLRNWDNYKTYEVMTIDISLGAESDAETYFKNYRGEYVQPPTQNSDDNYINWAGASSGYYKDSPVGIFIWPGGKVNGQYARPQPGIDSKIIKYEDHNLYSPFYGGYQEESGAHIYGQKHIGSGCRYNAADDTWEYTVTREFKNISGYEIEVEEMGYFGWNQSLMAKEVLTEPIVVQNDSYFKLSFTYKVKNPHENRETKRERLIRYGGRPSAHSAILSTSPSKEKNVMIITHCTYSGFAENTLGLEWAGWEQIQDPIIVQLSNRKIQINYFKPLPGIEENYIRTKGYYNNKDIYFTIYYCSEKVENFSIQKEEKFLYQTLKDSQNIFSITPNFSSVNKCFLFIGDYPSSLTVSQTDEERCDTYYIYNSYCNLFLDIKNSLSHTFKIEELNYDLYGLYFNVTVKNNVPLFYDSSVI